MIAKMKARGFRCSFCGKAKDEVAAIMAGAPQAAPGVPRGMIGKSAFICNECVALCQDISKAQVGEVVSRVSEPKGRD